jgi:hypothetical protein
LQYLGTWTLATPPELEDKLGCLAKLKFEVARMHSRYFSHGNPTSRCSSNSLLATFERHLVQDLHDFTSVMIHNPWITQRCDNDMPIESRTRPLPPVCPPCFVKCGHNETMSLTKLQRAKVAVFDAPKITATASTHPSLSQARYGSFLARTSQSFRRRTPVGLALVLGAAVAILVPKPPALPPPRLPPTACLLLKLSGERDSDEEGGLDLPAFIGLGTFKEQPQNPGAAVLKLKEREGISSPQQISKHNTILPYPYGRREAPSGFSRQSRDPTC